MKQPDIEYNTRNVNKIQTTHTRTDHTYIMNELRKFNFTNRVIPVWNSLPNRVVSADTTNTFKNHLDKFWSDQEVLYDYNADLHGIGNRTGSLL